MSDIYLTSCKFEMASPETAKRMNALVHNRYDMKLAGCCREVLPTLEPDDRVVTICNTCDVFAGEMTPDAPRISIWEVIAQDDTFPYPNYGGEEIALQDCWRANENPAIREAIRDIMVRMNLVTIELLDAHEQCRFCGSTLLAPAPAYYEEFAPKRFAPEKLTDVFQPHTDEEKHRILTQHCAGIPTDKVACYCVGCAQGLFLGGKKPVQVADLLLGV